MATTTVSVGSNQSIATVTPSSASGSNPYTVAFGSSPGSNAAVGDIVTMDDSANTGTNIALVELELLHPLVSQMNMVISRMRYSKEPFLQLLCLRLWLMTQALLIGEVVTMLLASCIQTLPSQTQL